MNMPDEEFPHQMQKFSRRLDWNLLKTFHDIVEANGITAAANVGWRKQSTISLALKRLEAIVGSRLCQRGRVGFELTDEGRILYEYVRKISSNIEEARSALANTKEHIFGELNVAIISNFSSKFIDEIYDSYCDSNPNVVINIEVLAWQGISKCIVGREYDVGISPILTKHNDLRYDFLETEFHNLYCGRRHHLFGMSLDLPSLADEAFVLTGSDEPDSLTSFRLRHRLGQKVTARTPSLEEARRLTVAGVGLCLLPEQFVAADVANGVLWPVRARSEEMSCDVYIITSLDRHKRAAKDAFIETTEKILGRRG